MPGGDPYCGHCGYELRGLTESARCPECGRPLVEVLQRRGQVIGGRRYTSPIRIFGLPLVQIALGPHGTERVGRARGIIAIGDKAVGVVAAGGMSLGVFAWGGFAAGGFAFGGLSAGLFSLGGVAVAVFVAYGGLALSLAAYGGVALGAVVVAGGVAIGWYARGGLAIGPYPLGGSGRSQEAVQFFQDYAWLFGRDRFGLGLFQWVLAAFVLTAALAFLVVLAGYARARGRGGE